MAVFYYSALDEKGKKRKGFIEAGSEPEAKQKLREQGVLVTEIKSSMRLQKKQNLSNDQLIIVTTMLAQLVEVGIPLYESLVTIEEQMRQEACHRVLLSLTEQVKGGSSLSEAMRSFPESFSSLYVSMIGAGEASGSLAVVARRLQSYLASRAHLQTQLTNALIYPAVLGIFSLVVILLLMGYVIPSMEGVFEGRTLNSYTQMVLSLSHYFRDYGWTLLLLLPAIGGSLFYFIRTEKGKEWMQRNLMKTPFIKGLYIQATVSRFCRTLSTLLEGGLPLVESLKIARGVMQNKVMEEEVLRAESKILEGSTLSTEFKRSRYLPPMAIRLLSIGEESGRQSEMLFQIAGMYEEDLEKNLARTLSLLQPVILIIMGFFVGLILISILLPLTDISSFQSLS